MHPHDHKYVHTIVGTWAGSSVYAPVCVCGRKQTDERIDWELGKDCNVQKGHVNPHRKCWIK